MSKNSQSHKLSGNIVIQSNNNKNQIIQSTNNNNQPALIQSQHFSIPPRYQPPPQPPGGILKNIPSSKTVSSGYTIGESHHKVPTHINLKYPPEVPKLATVYIPDGVRSSGVSSKNPQLRSSTSGVNHRQNQQHLLLSSASSTTSSSATVPTSQITQQQQQQHRLSLEEDQLNRLQAISAAGGQQGIPLDMLKFVRKADSEASAAAASSTSTTNSNSAAQARLSAEQNRHLQQMINELRTLKEANQLLSDDNQELRDLCCFLDDDRQKGRKLAREWQRFGRYTASVMRQEVSTYQNKLRQLDDKQQELIRDNLELKELCLYLDEERANATASVSTCTNCGASMRPHMRDDGDGSSSSTNADEPMPSIRQFERQVPELNIRPTLSDQALQYVKSLEHKIRQLEDENHKIIGNNKQTNSVDIIDPAANRPEAVVRALQILEVREQLERDRTTNHHQQSSVSPEQMDDGEKALVREMCNVVWRKLEDSPGGSGDQM